MINNLKKYDILPNTISGGTLFIGEACVPGIDVEKPRKIRIFLPFNYNEIDRFPVVYMMDGKNLFDKYTSFAGEWEVDEVLEKRIKDGKQSYIVVGIDSRETDQGRTEEMLPSDKYLEEETIGGKIESFGEKLGDWIVNDLKIEIDKLFKTLPDKINTSIIGSSMGGLFAFYMGLKYKDVFDLAGCFSPAFLLYENNKFIEELEKYQVSEELPKLYFLVGNIEFENEFIIQTKAAYDIFKNKGVTDEKIKLIHDLEGIHHESFWNKYLDDLFDFYENK